MTKPKSKTRKLHKNVAVAFARIAAARDALCRQISATDDAIKAGGGYVYFLRNSGKEMPPVSSRFLIDNGLVEEEQDGLFEGCSQSFRPVSFDRFHEFKSQYEASA
jgi:hypothetical protein|uniref:Uncharacterized protein n=1 Tax=viral metagenome TaxID=1070528 RepID=A0A6H1Z9U5_9ZZZZ